MDRLFAVLAGVAGFTAVALGAFGSHGLRGYLADAANGAKRLEWWSTASHYHLTHALAIGLAAWLVHRAGGGAGVVAGWCFVAGIVLFSGSLYAMTLTGVTRLGAITPVGGLLLLGGWAAVIIAAAKL